jgi:cytochrome d ubiquinol oxidase subunit II
VMDLSDGWMIFLFLALTMYIVLDGYDLGIGVLTLLDRDDGQRRSMFELVAWLWDGNESWLVLLALSVWAGIPLAAGVALPALYIPVIVMLVSLIARGLSIELIEQHPGWHPLWGRVFGYASLSAAFAQGVAFGGLVAGVTVRDGSFAGGPWSFLHHGYAVLTGLTAVALYVVAGSTWVHRRSDGVLRRAAGRFGRSAVLALAGGTILSWALLEAAGSTELDPGSASRLPVWLIGAAVLAASLALAYRSFADGSAANAGVVSVLAVYAGGLAVLLGLLYPTVVPPDITVHGAAAPRASLWFLYVGAGISIPIILTYQAFAYWVFRGKLPVSEEVVAR